MKKKGSSFLPLYLRRRLVLVAIVMIAFLAVLIFQFYSLQIIQGSKWELLAKKQHVAIVTEPFKRGNIYLTHIDKATNQELFVPVALDIQKFHLYVNPKTIPENIKETVSQDLFKELGLDPTLWPRFSMQFYKPSQSRRLFMWLNVEQKEKLLRWWVPYAKQHRLAKNAVYFISDYHRAHPYGTMLGQLLHNVQEYKEENTQQAIPTGGLELVLDPYLQGKQGKRRLLRSPRHAMEIGQVIEEPEDGADVYLTIDPFLQAIVEKELKIGVERVSAKSAWAVVMDPHSGNILAMGQYPYFDLNTYQDFFNDPSLIRETRCKAIQDACEPGSIVKPLMVAIALKGNLILKEKNKPLLFDPEAKLNMSHPYFPGRKKPMRDVTFHRFLNLDMALQKSSNVYMGLLGQKIVEQFGNEWFKDQLVNVFGFGVPTGFKWPGEALGFVPSSGKYYPSGRPEWSGSTPYSLVMGYNMLASSVQLARAYSVVANGGYWVNPRLVSKIVKKDQVIIPSNPSIKEDIDRSEPVLPFSVCQRLIAAMKYDTKLGGTAARADVAGYTEIGKTGTAEKIVGGSYSKKDHLATFAGFAPAKNPTFVIVICVDEPKAKFVSGVGKLHHGSYAAAPIFEKIAQHCLTRLMVPPDDPYGYPYRDPRADRTRADWVKEAQSLKELYQEWNKKGP